MIEEAFSTKTFGYFLNSVKIITLQVTEETLTFKSSYETR